jgi:hypothetical protein
MAMVSGGHVSAQLAVQELLPALSLSNVYRASRVGPAR